MDDKRITQYEQVEERFLESMSVFRKAVKEKKWGRVLGWLTYHAAIGIILFAGFMVTLGGGLSWLGVIKENITAPDRELQYTKKSEDERGGKYYTTFSLRLSAPPGKTGGMFLYTYPVGCDNDHAREMSRGTELKNSYLYAIKDIEIDCVTNEPLVERSELLFEPQN